MKIFRSNAEIEIFASNVKEGNSIVGKHAIVTEDAEEISNCISFSHPGLNPVGSKVLSFVLKALTT